MSVVLFCNAVLIITINAAIPLMNSNNHLTATTNITTALELQTLSWPPNDGYCRKNASCIVRNSTCFGVPLPYAGTSTDVVVQLFNNRDLHDFKNIEQELSRWESLRKVPKCWQALQPFLCALYMPKCEYDTVYLLSQERCKFMMSTCKILYEPAFREAFPHINCEAIEHFPPTCKNDVKDLRSNLSGECIPPLIATDNAESYYDVVNGCGVQCQDPLLTKDEHDQIHILISWFASISLFFNLFAVVSFLIEWRSGNKYPALIIFYINICFLISNVGWLAQFFPKAREDIVCKKDMTLRQSEPSSGENLTCVVVFVSVYYFLMAACVWLVILTYAWHLSFQALGKIQGRIDKKGAYFHMVAWSLPLVLTIITMASRQIDGNSTAGICFVRSSEWKARFGLVLIPIAATILVGGFFLSRGLSFLYGIKKDSQQILSPRASGKIQNMIRRIVGFSFFCLLFVVITFICHVYEFIHEDSWQESLRDYIFCLILSSKSDPRECKMASRPSVSRIQIHLLALFGAGIAMSTWVWTSSTYDTWKRFFNRVFNKQIQEPIVLKKHKIIAQAFAKRKELTNAGKLDLHIRNSHTDPVGLKFELNSSASQLSSNWIAAIPKLVDRRGALIAPSESNSSNNNKRRNSYDSESYTLSVRRVSVESRRHSLDSQISLQISEVTATHKTNTPRPGHHGSRSRGKRRRKDFSRKRHHNSTRRGSSTSQESQLGMILAVANSNLFPKDLGKRRSGNAGLGNANIVVNRLPMNLSDDQSQGEQVADDVHINISEDEPSAASDFDLCEPGQGIQALDTRESDSDFIDFQHSRGYSDEEESARIEKILEKAITARQLHKNKLHIRDLEYHKKSYRSERRSKYKPDDYSVKGSRYRNRNGDSVSLANSLLQKSSRQQIKIHKNEYSQSKHRCRNGTGVQKNLAIECHRGSHRIHCSKESDSETDFDEDACLMQQSVATQICGDSGRSKRSVTVDVGTQISTQEMATQTEPDDHVVLRPTSNQGTQMTPPFHIRVINKSLGGNGF